MWFNLWRASPANLSELSWCWRRDFHSCHLFLMVLGTAALYTTSHLIIRCAAIGFNVWYKLLFVHRMLKSSFLLSCRHMILSLPCWPRRPSDERNDTMHMWCSAWLQQDLWDSIRHNNPECEVLHFQHTMTLYNNVASSVSESVPRLT